MNKYINKSMVPWWIHYTVPGPWYILTDPWYCNSFMAPWRVQGTVIYNGRPTVTDPCYHDGSMIPWSVKEQQGCLLVKYFRINQRTDTEQYSMSMAAVTVDRMVHAWVSLSHIIISKYSCNANKFASMHASITRSRGRLANTHVSAFCRLPTCLPTYLLYYH